MRADDVMTRNVVSVDPETPVQKLAALLSECGIGGAPVIDKAGRMVGIVSEGDVLHRSEIGTATHGEPRRWWWLEHFASDFARAYVKSHGRTVKDIMTRDVVAVTEETDLADIATLLETKRIKRVPVMRDGRVVGVVSRSNLVRALGATTGTVMSETRGDDRAIRTRLLDELMRQDWAAGIWAQDIIVSNGVVHLWFSSDDSDDKRQASRVAAENVPGVTGVEEHVMPASLIPPI